jgi:hypothetical protein
VIKNGRAGEIGEPVGQSLQPFFSCPFAQYSGRTTLAAKLITPYSFHACRQGDFSLRNWVETFQSNNLRFAQKNLVTIPLSQSTSNEG